MQNLEKDTPLIEYNYSYNGKLTEEEVHEHQERIAQLTIDIMNRSEQIRQLNAEMKADNDYRTELAATLDIGKTQRIADMAVKFYDKSANVVSIFVTRDGGYDYVMSRAATEGEQLEWRKRQDEIRQMEIESGHYRRQLEAIAEAKSVTAQADIDEVNETTEGDNVEQTEI